MGKIKNIEEIELIRSSCMLVSDTLAELAAHLKPGISTIELDKIAEEFIRSHGGEPGFKGYRGFPFTLCISVNDQVVHGFPSERRVEEGDILSIDCGVKMNDYFGDSAYSFAIGEISEELEKLMSVTKTSLYNAISVAVPGSRIGDIGNAVQNACEKENGYGVVRDLVGHGIGKNLHEAPEVPNFGSPGRGMKLEEGMVIAIEPMVNLGKNKVVQEDDGWTIATRDGKHSAHYEHVVAIKAGGADILTSFEKIELEEDKNANLKSIKVLQQA